MEPRFSFGFQSASKRASSFGAGALKTEFKDPRNIKSKEFKEQAQNKINSFFERNEIDFKMPFANPTKTAFYDCFLLIFQFLDPEYGMEDQKNNEKNRLLRLDQELPGLLHGLGYPTAIKSSTMATMTAPHCWPEMLAVLAWLVDLIELANQIQPQEILLSTAETEEDVFTRSLHYSYAIECYTTHKRNPNNGAAMDAFFEKYAKELAEHNNLAALRADAEERIRQAEADIEAFQEGESRELQQLAEADKLRNDIAMLSDYNDQRRMELDAKKRRLEDAREELAVLEKKTKDLVDELAKRKAAVIEQEKSGGLTGTAAKALVLENKENRNRLQELDQEAEGLNKQHWQQAQALKTAMATARQEYQTMAGKIRTLRCQMGLGEDTENSLSNKDLQDPKTLFHALGDGLKSQLTKLRAEAEDAIGQHKKATHQNEQMKAKLEAEVAIQEERLAAVHVDRVRSEKKTRRAMEEWQKERLALAKDVELLEQEKEALTTKEHEAADLDAAIRLAEAELVAIKQQTLLVSNEIEGSMLDPFLAMVENLKAFKEQRAKMLTQLDLIASILNSFNSTC